MNETFQSLSDQLYKNFEVIIVSDNSSDSSVEIAKQFKCKIIELPKNMGPAFARNKGAEIAENDILFFVDSDVIIKKDALNYLNNKLGIKSANPSSTQGLNSLLSPSMLKNHFKLYQYFPPHPLAVQ